MKRAMTLNTPWRGVLLGIALFLGSMAVGEASDRPLRDPQKIMGPQECAECHKAEVHNWRQTKHSKSFKQLARSKETKAMTKKMGIKRITKGPACTTCHFTVGPNKRGKIRAIAGISCESCHSPSKDWIKVHGDFGGKDVPKEKETPAHKAERLAKIQESGMIRPVDIIRLARNCYQCHTIPDERLVNVGGHKPGSQFELMSWLQGEVRHNFLESTKTELKKNREASAERKRVLYIVGRVLDLEFSLRGLGQASQKGKYADAMVERVRNALAQLEEIQVLTPLPGVQQSLTVGKGIPLTIEQGNTMKAALEKIAAAGQAFAQTHDGAELSALDQLMVKPDKYKGKVWEGKLSK